MSQSSDMILPLRANFTTVLKTFYTGQLACIVMVRASQSTVNACSVAWSKAKSPKEFLLYWTQIFRKNALKYAERSCKFSLQKTNRKKSYHVLHN